VVYADWKEVWCNAVKPNCTITYFTSVLGVALRSQWDGLKSVIIKFVEPMALGFAKINRKKFH